MSILCIATCGIHTGYSSRVYTISSGLIFRNPSISQGLILDKNKVYANSEELYPPTNLSITEYNPTSLTISFTPPLIKGTATQYKVFQTSPDKGYGELVAVGIGVNSIVVPNLNSSTSYTFVIKTYNNGIESKASTPVTGGTTSTSAWNSITTPAGIGLAPELVYPRPDTETSTGAFHRNAYPGIPWEIPISVRHGRWPFKYTIVNNGGAVGLTIGETLTVSTDLIQIDDGTHGVLSWANPVAGSYTITVNVKDQNAVDSSVTFTLVVSTSAFVFLDAVNGDDTLGDGTLGNPLQTIHKGLIKNSTTDNTFQDKIAYLKTGSYIASTGDPAVTPNQLEINTNKVTSLVQYPGHSAIIDTSLARINWNRDDFYLGNGITVDGNKTPLANQNASWKPIIAGGFHNRQTFFKVNFTNQILSNNIGENPACIYTSSAGIGSTTTRTYMVVSRCTTDTNTVMDLLTFYDVTKGVIELNVCNSVTLEDNSTNGAFIYLKEDTDLISIRRNVATKITYSGAGKGVIGAGTQDVSSDVEMCWNTVRASMQTTTYAGHMSIGLNFLSYRNTFISTDSSAFGISVVDTGAVAACDSNLYGRGTGGIAFPSATPTGYTTTNELELNPDDFDANGSLVDGGTNATAKTDNLGLRGAEVK